MGPRRVLKTVEVRAVRLSRPNPYFPQGPGIQCGNQGSTVPSHQDSPQQRLEVLTLLASSPAGQAGPASFHSCVSDRDEAWSAPPDSPPTHTPAPNKDPFRPSLCGVECRQETVSPRLGQALQRAAPYQADTLHPRLLRGRYPRPPRTAGPGIPPRAFPWSWLLVKILASFRLWLGLLMM